MGRPEQNMTKYQIVGLNSHDDIKYTQYNVS